MTVDHLKSLQASCRFIEDIIDNNRKSFLDYVYPECNQHVYDITFCADYVLITSPYGEKCVDYVKVRNWIGEI